MEWLIFDYDYSLIDVNSDTHVIEKLAPGLMSAFETHRDSGLGWTQTMDLQMWSLWREGVSVEAIVQCLSDVPAHPAMLQALKAVATRGGVVRVLSDANELFIGTFLSKAGLAPLVDAVVTNFSRVDGTGRMHVLPHTPEDAPHGCPHCPPNLCKGEVVRGWLEAAASEPPHRIVYVGDGGGDFCAACALRPGDTVLARRDRTAARRYGLWEKIAGAKAGMVRATVLPWHDGGDVLAAVAELGQINKILN